MSHTNPSYEPESISKSALHALFSLDDKYPEDWPVIDGYEILEPISEGGMGKVWRAFQLSTKRDVAIKTIHSSLLRSTRAQVRFQQEIELTAKLRHPSIVRLFDGHADSNLCYYTMDYVDGQTWLDYANSSGVKPSTLVRQAITLAAALDYAHQNRVVHRDLKPANVLVDENHTPVLVDFGLAKLEDGGQGQDNTLLADPAGTLAYSSPEQAQGRHSEVGPTSDVYSLGVTLHKLLSGDLPYPEAKNAEELMRHIADGNTQLQLTHKGKLCEKLEPVISKALQLRPEDRFDSAKSFSEALEESLDGCTTDVSSSGKTWRFVAAVLMVFILVFSVSPLWRHFISNGWLKPESPQSDASDSLPGNAQASPESTILLTKTQAIGGKKGNDHEDINPAHQPLVGFKIRVADIFGDKIIKTIQPIYRARSSAELIYGTLHGKPTMGEEIELVAPDGYAIGALEARGGIRLHALRVTYMPFDGNRLDPESPSVHKTDWFGGLGDGNEWLLGGDGNISVGIHGFFGVDINRVGLVMFQSVP